MAATLDDLKDAVKTTLESRGVIDSLRARMRAEIFAALDDGPAAKPALSNENLVINELIREYMEFNGYKHSLSVFMPETGQPVERAFSRPFLAEQLHVAEDETTRRVPLLYSILGEMRNAAPPAAAHHGGAGAEAGVTAYGGADGGGGGAAAATTGDVTGAAAGDAPAWASGDIRASVPAHGLGSGASQAALDSAAAPLSFSRR